MLKVADLNDSNNTITSVNENETALVIVVLCERRKRLAVDFRLEARAQEIV